MLIAKNRGNIEPPNYWYSEPQPRARDGQEDPRPQAEPST